MITATYPKLYLQDVLQEQSHIGEHDHTEQYVEVFLPDLLHCNARIIPPKFTLHFVFEDNSCQSFYDCHVGYVGLVENFDQIYYRYKFYYRFYIMWERFSES